MNNLKLKVGDIVNVQHWTEKFYITHVDIGIDSYNLRSVEPTFKYNIVRHHSQVTPCDEYTVGSYARCIITQAIYEVLDIDDLHLHVRHLGTNSNHLRLITHCRLIHYKPSIHKGVANKNLQTVDPIYDLY